MRRALWSVGLLFFAAALMACGGEVVDEGESSALGVMANAKQHQETNKVALKHAGGGGDQVKAQIQARAQNGELGPVQTRDRDRARDGECACDEGPCGECEQVKEQAREQQGEAAQEQTQEQLKEQQGEPQGCEEGYGPCACPEDPLQEQQQLETKAKLGDGEKPEEPVKEALKVEEQLQTQACCCAL